MLTNDMRLDLWLEALYTIKLILDMGVVGEDPHLNGLGGGSAKICDAMDQHSTTLI